MEDMGQTEETFETEVRRKVTRTAFKIEEVSGEMAITLKCKLVISSYLEMIIIVGAFGLAHPSSSGQEIIITLLACCVVNGGGWLAIKREYAIESNNRFEIKIPVSTQEQYSHLVGPSFDSTQDREKTRRSSSYPI